MPKALVIDDDDIQPRRRGRAKRAVVEDVEVERNLLMRVLLYSPKDTVAGGIALVAIGAIVVNAMFMQPGRHPAPMFHTAFPLPDSAPAAASAPVAQSAAASTTQSQAVPAASPLPRPRPVEAEVRPADPVAQKLAAHGPASTVARPPAPIPATRSDPVGDLIVSTRRVAAVQRALTDFGYGQLKPTGVIGTDTQTAIQKFERERKLPVTGQISDRLVRELGAMTGRAID
ncbi:peptidoglycan-binding protein [Bradyrhizobium sp. U87765 SZCCT0131]|uniref:peptidoglycan-binding domain-containing protein n=1 Tax=unclassified Bradyrhizobium TaxID=2631580 RepID=UPI001BA7B30C|nr:peptidoglycan-binding protein [Bradyrhizobium sp. U87765 SZCCT0131]MBR1265284.1 peptidoglycan-binding protein [Bradyrhizobium sp. U87765 SZCCT0134]MBR1302937.1 peptidoglycan-binding protein [Bradyrhizobium sp. U87765 SZCCT0110]MBR1323635.1 peptidoglycan-binding protein [Bradyrhizobium sp. U87765 SZCCT0109]MBR1346866.1 peptidoglycan-binding protein [Bradyrhizobium sp. U87765 SZCCT0048]